MKQKYLAALNFIVKNIFVEFIRLQNTDYVI